MPKRPKSKQQLQYVHHAAKMGEEWAKDLLQEWHGKKFKSLPRKSKSHK